MEKQNILSITKREDFRNWLKENHDKEAECFIELKRGKPLDDGAFYYLDAIEEALCFGWIDSTVIKLGEKRLQRFSPRQKNGNWTELNKERVRRLQKLGLMDKAGEKVLPSMGPRSFVLNKEIENDLKKAKVYAKFKKLPELYQRVRGYNLMFYYKRDKDAYEKMLNHTISSTKELKTFGEWNDYGRLLNY